MKLNLFVPSLLVLFVCSPELLAQKAKSSSEFQELLITETQNKVLPVDSVKSSAIFSGIKLPGEDQSPLVSVQEPKVQITGQKKKQQIGEIPNDQTSNLSKIEVPKAKAEPVVITATRVAQPLSQIGLPVTVITREDIERKKDLVMPDILRSVPGINVVRTGRRGRTTSIFIRGANSNHTLFMIDGVQLNSPTTGAFDPAFLTLEEVDRIEIIRGPQSTLYGSDAIGGVVNVITRKGRGKTIPVVTGRFEYGSQNTFYESGTLSGLAGPVDYFGSFSRLDSDAGVAGRRVEKDGLEDTNVSGRMGINLPLDSRLDLFYRYTLGYTATDDGAFQNDPNRWNRNRDNLVSSALTLNPFSWLTQTLKASYFDSKLVSIDPPDPATKQSESRFKLDAKIYTLDFQNTVRPFETNALTGGYEFEVQRANNRTFDKFIRNHGFYLQDQQSFWDRLFLTGGARLEENGAFGSAVNPKVSLAYLLRETGTKFKGSFGTGFRAPTLNQLYFPNFGNPDLQPEKSRSFEYGVEQNLPFWNSRVEANLFHTQFESLIQSVAGPMGFIAQNTAKASSQGMELELSSEPILGILDLTGFYTYMVTHDKSVGGAPLLRRPKHAGGITLNIHPCKRLNVNLDAHFVGNRNDSSFIFGRPSREKISGYGILDMTVSFDLTKHWQIYGRAENITNTDYEEVLGFPTSDALFFSGVKMKY